MAKKKKMDQKWIYIALIVVLSIAMVTVLYFLVSGKTLAGEAIGYRSSGMVVQSDLKWTTGDVTLGATRTITIDISSMGCRAYPAITVYKYENGVMNYGDGVGYYVRSVLPASFTLKNNLNAQKTFKWVAICP